MPGRRGQPEGAAMTTTKNNWLFSLLWINAAVVVVWVIQLAGNQNWRAGDLLRAVGYTVLIANITGLLGMLVLSRVATWVAQRKIPPMPILCVGILLVSAVGLLL